jgi:hypothetical protein
LQNSDPVLKRRNVLGQRLDVHADQAAHPIPIGHHALGAHLEPQEASRAGSDDALSGFEMNAYAPDPVKDRGNVDQVFFPRL